MDEIEHLKMRLGDKDRGLKLLRDENAKLRAAIKTYLDGKYSTTKKNDKCKHDRYGFECCENCIDEYFMGVIGE